MLITTEWSQRRNRDKLRNAIEEQVLNLGTLAFRALPRPHPAGAAAAVSARSSFCGSSCCESGSWTASLLLALDWALSVSSIEHWAVATKAPDYPPCRVDPTMHDPRCCWSSNPCTVLRSWKPAAVTAASVALFEALALGDCLTACDVGMFEARH